MDHQARCKSSAHKLALGGGLRGLFLTGCFAILCSLNGNRDVVDSIKQNPLYTGQTFETFRSAFELDSPDFGAIKCIICPGLLHFSIGIPGNNAKNDRISGPAQKIEHGGDLGWA